MTSERVLKAGATTSWNFIRVSETQCFLDGRGHLDIRASKGMAATGRDELRHWENSNYDMVESKLELNFPMVGGPIVYRDLNVGNVVFKVAGVISGFQGELLPVAKPTPIKSPAEASATAKAEPWRIVQKSADKTWYELQDTGDFVNSNTGIVLGYSITAAIDLIHQHPIGPMVPKQP